MILIHFFVSYKHTHTQKSFFFYTQCILTVVKLDSLFRDSSLQHMNEQELVNISFYYRIRDTEQAKQKHLLSSPFKISKLEPNLLHYYFQKIIEWISICTLWSSCLRQ